MCLGKTKPFTAFICISFIGVFPSIGVLGFLYLCNADCAFLILMIFKTALLFIF